MLRVAGMARSYSGMRRSCRRLASASMPDGVGARHARGSALGICLSRYRGHGPLVPRNMAFWAGHALQSIERFGLCALTGAGSCRTGMCGGVSEREGTQPEARKLQCGNPATRQSRNSSSSHKPMHCNLHQADDVFPQPLRRAQKTSQPPGSGHNPPPRPRRELPDLHALLRRQVELVALLHAVGGVKDREVPHHTVGAVLGR